MKQKDPKRRVNKVHMGQLMKVREIEKKEEGRLPLQNNEFTTRELYGYLYRVYGSKLNGLTFTGRDVNGWLEAGCLPIAYGGNKIKKRYLSGIRLLVIDGLTRDVLDYVKENMELPTVEEAKKQAKKPKRTALYYQLARKQKPNHVLPDNWREIGITGKQLNVHVATPKKKKARGRPRKKPK